MVRQHGPPPGLHPRGLRPPGRDRHREPQANPPGRRRQGPRRLHGRHRPGLADQPLLLAGHLPRALPAVRQEGQRLGPRPHEVEDPQALLRRVRAADRRLHRRRLRRPEPRPDLRPRHGPRSTSSTPSATASSSGAAASTRSRPSPSARPTKSGVRSPSGCGSSAGRRLRLQRHPQHPGGHPVANLVALFEAVREERSSGA